MFAGCGRAVPGSYSDGLAGATLRKRAVSTRRARSDHHRSRRPAVGSLAVVGRMPFFFTVLTRPTFHRRRGLYTLKSIPFDLLLPWEKRSCRRFYRLGGNSCVTGMRATMPDSRIGESDMRKTTENVSKRPGHNYRFDSPSSYFPKKLSSR